MNKQAEEAMIASEIGGGHYQHPAYDAYDPLTLKDGHGPVPAAARLARGGRRRRCSSSRARSTRKAA